MCHLPVSVSLTCPYHEYIKMCEEIACNCLSAAGCPARTHCSIQTYRGYSVTFTIVKRDEKSSMFQEHPFVEVKMQMIPEDRDLWSIVCGKNVEPDGEGSTEA